MRCKNCDAEKIVTLPKREHEFGNWEVTTPATCETEGAEARTCKLCGYTETRTVPAEQHDFSDWIEKTHADCTHSGTETRFCRKCNFTETRKIKALGHAWNRWHPSAKKEKTAERYCSRCGKTEEEAFDYETAEKQYGTKIKDAPPIWADHLRDQEDAKEALRRQEAQRMREVQARKEALARQQQAIEEQRRQEKFAAQEKRREIITRKFNIINAIAVVSWILLDFLALVGIDIGWAFTFSFVFSGVAGVTQMIGFFISKNDKRDYLIWAIVQFFFFIIFLIMITIK